MIEKLLNYVIRSQLLVWLSIIGLAVGGLFSLAGLQRESYPKVDFHSAQIRTIFPGAAPVDVEQRVTIPLEEEIREIEGLKKVRSISRHSVSELNVEVDLNESDPDKVLDEVRRALDRVTDLPPEVTERPIFMEQKTGTFPVLELSLYGIDDERELSDVAEFFETQIEKVKGVARVDVFGERDHEWHVLVDPEKMRRKLVNLQDVVQTLSGRNVNIPGGTVESEQAVNIRTSGEFKTIHELANMPVQSNEIGGMTKLRDIARFEESFEAPTMLARTNGKRAINLLILKRERADLVTVAKDIQEKVIELQKIRPVTVSTVMDESSQTRRRLDVVSSNATIGFIIVVIMLLLFLNFRTAIVTAVSLPLVLLATLIIFPVYSITFNMISMMGIIIALGMLVDNSIVIAENVHRYRELGMGPIEAATKGASELVIPILGSFLTTVAAFIPMMFMSGMMGKFIWQIPFLVIVSLSASLIESFFLLPARLARFSEGSGVNPSRIREALDGFFDGMANGFARFVHLLVGRPFISFGVMTLFVFLALGSMAFMKFSLFPKEEVEQVVIKAEFDPSTRVSQTLERMSPIEDLVRSLPKTELVTYSMKAGLQQTDAGDPLTRNGENLAMINIYLTPEVTRKRTAEDIVKALEPKMKQTPGLRSLSVQEVVPSPPIGAAITVAAEGAEYEKLKQISEEVKAYLSTVKGVKNITDDYKTGREEIIVKLNQERAAMAGINDQLAALTVRAAFEGAEATTLRQGKQEITIRVLYDDAFRSQAERLRSIQIPNRERLHTSLGAISSFDTTAGPESLAHYDFERAITISADVDDKIITSGKANELIFEKFGDIEKRMPGYSLKLRGEEQETNESMLSLLKAGMAAAFAIFAIIALIFNSPIRSIIIICTTGLGLVGISIGFLTSGKALSFLALIGIIGLAGVQVNAGIMIVEFIDKARQEGLSPVDAVVDAARTRFRPILLTSLTTMGGLFPTAYSIGGSDPVLIPMTLALAWGLASGTFGSLMFIPVVFACGYRIRDWYRKKRGQNVGVRPVETIAPDYFESSNGHHNGRGNTESTISKKSFGSKSKGK